MREGSLALGVGSPRCPYCHESVRPDDGAKRACTACMAWHHDPCWDEHGGCAACGATPGAARPRPAPARAKDPKGDPGAGEGRRRVRSAAAAAALAVVAVAAIGAAAAWRGGAARVGPDWHAQLLDARDEAEATRWCRVGAEQGDPAAMSLLGYRLSLGLGCRRDDADALRWELLAAGRGDAQAMYFVGTKHEAGRGGLAVDEAEAARWYRRAVEAGNAQAILRLEALLRRRPDLREPSR